MLLSPTGESFLPAVIFTILFRSSGPSRLQPCKCNKNTLIKKDHAPDVPEEAIIWNFGIKALSLDSAKDSLLGKMQNLDSIDLSGTQRRAVMKLAVELVKADDRIHSKEVMVLDELQSVLGLDQQELDLIHYLSLESAVDCLKELDKDPTDGLINLFNEIMCSDNDIDFEENLLLSSISMSCDSGSRDWCRILSANAIESEAPEKQIVFLESRASEAAHLVLDDKYDNLLISKAFGDIGIEFFYLPDILREFDRHLDESDRFGLLKRSMEYLVPAGDKIKLNHLKESLTALDTRAFYHLILSRFGIDPERIPYTAFLLMRIRDSHILDDSDTLRRTVDFLCIDISSEVKKRILTFVSRFDEKRDRLSYKGYYKFLYDYLSAEAKFTNPISINSKGDFTLESGDTIRFKSAPQAKTLYMLLLSRGDKGISQTDFNKAVSFLKELNINEYLTSTGDLDLPRFKEILAGKDDEYARVILDTIAIYRSFSTKDSGKKDFLEYVQSILRHRSSLKTYINTGFASARKLANPEQYLVSFNPDTKTYSVSASPSLFTVSSECSSSIPLTDSPLWKTAFLSTHTKNQK